MQNFSELTDLEKLALLHYVGQLPEEINLIYVPPIQTTYETALGSVKIEHLRFGFDIFAGYEEETKTLVIREREI